MLTEGTIFGERVIFCDGGFRVLGRRSKKSGSGGKRESPPTGGAQKKKNNACPLTIVHAVSEPKYEGGYPIVYLVSCDVCRQQNGGPVIVFC